MGKIVSKFLHLCVFGHVLILKPTKSHILNKRKSKLQLAPIEVCTCSLQLSPVKPDLAQFFFSIRDVWEGILFVIISFFICSVFYLLQLNS